MKIRSCALVLLAVTLFLCFSGCMPRLREESSLNEEAEKTEDTADQASEEMTEENLILPGEKGSFSFTAMSLNVRRYYAEDTGVLSVEERKKPLSDYFRKISSDVILLQEAPREWYAPLMDTLSDLYFFSADLPNIILVKKERFSICQEGAFYLSETPEKKSVGWDAKNERSCQWVLLENAENGARLFVYNTHLDHVGVKARMESAKMIAENLKTLEYPYLLGGDLNCKEESYPYNTLCEVLLDCRKEAAETDSGSTYHGWGSISDEKGYQIDFLFACPINVKINTFHILRDRWGEGNFYSDHYAVRSEMEILY